MHDVIDKIQKKFEQVMPDIAEQLKSELKLVVPVAKGNLRFSIEVFTTKYGLIINMLDYGKYVEFGSHPYIGRKDKSKKFLMERKKLIAKGKRLGTRPNPFVRNTIRNKLGKIIKRELFG